MMKILKLTLVNIDGCAVGVSAEDGTPTMKPWRILVSSEHVGEALEGHLCDRSQAHARCEGSRTAGTANYPRRLCELIYGGLDAHERERNCISHPEVAVEVGTLVARSVVELIVGRDKVGPADCSSPKFIEPSVGRDGDIDTCDPNLKGSAVAPKGNIVDPIINIDDPCWQLFCLELTSNLGRRASPTARRSSTLRSQSAGMEATDLIMILVSSAFGAH